VEVDVEKLLLKPSEVGQALGIGRSLVYGLIAQGVIPSVRLGRSIRVPKASLEKWIVDHEKAKGDGQNTTVSNGSALSKD
jgi:excisionase family DNA binding protein